MMYNNQCQSISKHVLFKFEYRDSRLSTCFNSPNLFLKDWVDYSAQSCPSSSLSPWRFWQSNRPHVKFFHTPEHRLQKLFSQECSVTVWGSNFSTTDEISSRITLLNEARLIVQFLTIPLYVAKTLKNVFNSSEMSRQSMKKEWLSQLIWTFGASLGHARGKLM